MKCTALILTAGLAAGVLSHTTWFLARQPHPPDQFEAQLAWMRTQLELSSSQYAQIRDLHERLRPQLSELSQDVARMRAELAAFESQRLTAGQIDFLEFARFVDERRGIDEACNVSTRQLVDEAVGVLTPEQRKRYLSILAPVLSDGQASTFH